MSSNAPLPVFRFKVDFFISTADSGNKGNSKPICSGSFSECTGIEVNLEPKAIKVGGHNQGDIQLAGRTTYGTVILKRGISTTRDMWDWFDLVSSGAYAYRLDAEIMLRDYCDGEGEGIGISIGIGNKSKDFTFKWKMKNCLPTKFKTADFNAISNQVGIEELHFVHEGLSHERS